jgi:hypothetical protein
MTSEGISAASMSCGSSRVRPETSWCRNTWIERELALSKNTVADIVRWNRATSARN